MKKVITHQKKMKNTMYIVFGVFALALFAITRGNLSYASDGLILDDALDAIAESTVISTPLPEDEKLNEEENQSSEDGDIIESELTSDERLSEGGEISQDLENVNLEGDDEDDKENEEVPNEVENKENETISEEDKEATEETEKIEEQKNEDNNLNQEAHRISDEDMDKGAEYLGDFGFEKLDNINLELMNNGFTVTFNLNGGYWSEETDETKKYEQRQITSNGNKIGNFGWKTPSREGNSCNGKKCMFDGWYYTGLTKKFTGDVMGDINVYARWLPFEDLNITLKGKTFTIMDRNLGATSSGTVCNYDEHAPCGYHFQWGNNNGFEWNPNSIFQLPNGEIMTNNQETGWENYISTYYNPKWNKNMTWNSGSTNNDNLRGGSYLSDIFRQGPCPEGYHVPTKTEWKNVMLLFDNTSDFNILKNTLLLPTTAMRNAGQYGGDVYNIGTTYGYWTSTQREAGKADGLIVNNNIGVNSRLDKRNYGYGLGVRCFKNSPTTISFITNSENVLSDIQAKKRYEEGITLENPVRNDGNSIFLGRYTTEDFADGTEVTTTNLGNTGKDKEVLYAKWGCNTGYKENEDGTECVDRLNIKYHPNGGAFSGMKINETKQYMYSYSGTEIIPIYNIQIPDRQSEDISQQSGWMFDGWYTKSGDNNDWGEEFDVSNPQSTIAYAKWLPFNDINLGAIGLTGVLIMDRNLGAEDISSGAYLGNGNHEEYSKLGKYYQWGNNYGFKNNGNSINIDLTGTRINTEGYGPENYFYSNVFITINNNPKRRSENDNRNLWGGNSSTNSDKDKRGPCPSGYHIPDYNEWNNVKNIFETERNNNKSIFCEEFVDSGKKGACFTSKFNLPFAGSRSNTNGTPSGRGFGSAYRTSTSNGEENAQNLNYSDFGVGVSENIQSYGFSVRCFKDSQKDIVFKSNGGTEVTSKYLTKRWREETEPVLLPGSDVMIKENRVFDGWYTTSGFDEGTKVTTTDIEANSNEETVILYAKWKCGGGSLEDSELDDCLSDLNVTFNPNGGSFSGMEMNEIKEYTYERDENGIIPIYNIQAPDRQSDDMSQQSGWMFAGWYTKDGTSNDWGEEFDISNPQSTIAYAKWLPFNDLEVTFSGTKIILMDRNLGAEDVAEGIRYDYNQGHEDYRKYGYYYQWGNNYGFRYPEQGVNEKYKIIGEQIEFNKMSGGNNNYYYNVFVKRTQSPYRWDYEGNKNLWGGEDFKNSDIEKQGPCPKGYHIPDAQERKSVYDFFISEKNNNPELCSSFGNKSGICFTSKLKLPFQSGRWSYSVDKADTLGAELYIWSSSPNDIRYYPSQMEENSYMLMITNENGVSIGDTNRIIALPLRCMKNSNLNTLTLKTNNEDNNEQFKMRRREKLEQYINNPEYTGYKLIGRYDDPNYGTNTITTGNLISDKTIYAKREKTPWYIFNSNGGLFDSGENEYILKSKYYEYKTIIRKLSDNTTTRNVIMYTGASYLNLTLFWKSANCNNNVKVYNCNRVIDNTCGEYINPPSNYYSSTVQSTIVTGDVLTIETCGTSSCRALSYEAIIEAIGLNNYHLEGIPIPTYSGYEFSGWYTLGATKPFDFTGTEVTKDRTFYAKWNPHHYTITFNVNEGTGVTNDINVTYGEETQLPIVTKEGYTFKGWKSENGIIYNNVVSEGTGVTTEDGVTVILTAQWERIQESSGNTPSGGGGKSSSKDKQHNAATDEPEKEKISIIEDKSNEQNEIKEDEQKENKLSIDIVYDTNYTSEQIDAYTFAKSKGITTTPTIQKAKMNTSLKRIEMAKMLSYYAINVLGQKPDSEKGVVKFNDVTNKLDKQYDNGVTLAYQLGIMGINMKNNNFRPYDEVTRAEFVTALSRMIYGTKDGTGKTRYYEPHMAKLYNEGIITNTNPKLKEMRGYVMLMLMRSVK